jgi:2-dehydro-3-deoxyphosphogluconate aldolase/(4S)-4-hydroxy-2-oxoglutarate aldolase
VNRILEKRVIPVVTIDDSELAVPLGQALIDGGLDIVEIAFRTPCAEESIRRLVAELPQMLVGAGTMLEADEVRRAHDAGARFAVSPGTNREVVEAANERDMLMIAGVATPSEVERALGLGCKFLKFFPAEPSGGVSMLRALAAPYAHTDIQFIPTGGINARNMGEYLVEPGVAAICGSWMVNKALLAGQQWADISEFTRGAMTIVQTVGD